MIVHQGAVFAHRGLWQANGPPENSLAAFQAAAAAGLGIELDVQLSKDGVPVVFHDPVLDRMTGVSGFIWEQSYDALSTLQLGQSNETIPTLTAVMQALPKGTPVLVELKATPGDKSQYARAVDMALFGAAAETAVMSFDLKICAALRRYAPGHTLGALLNAKHLSGDTWHARLQQICDFAPDYIGHWHADGAEIAAVSDLPRAAWTVDSEEALVSARAADAAIIFEKLTLDLVRPEPSP